MGKGIVFGEPNRLNAAPFTTSDIIAECADVKHHAIKQPITKHESDFNDFGQVPFEMRAVKKERGTKFTKMYISMKNKQPC